MTDLMNASSAHVASVEAVLREKLEALSLPEKVSLLTGADFWSTLAVPSIGLGSMVLSDGPAGVRGPAWDERDTSLNLPSGTALAATWDVELAHRYGEVLAAEARRKGVSVVLGPTINLHRSPRGGRHFEAFSEDPVVTGDIAVAYTQGLQGQGIAAVPKHYVGNDSEDERFHVDVRIDDQTLHELYLAPFEAAVMRGGAWGVMSAYNQVNGVTMSESPLLAEPLCGAWGFDGAVISDWTAVRSTVASAKARQDLAMPGPSGPWGEALLAEVQAGLVSETDVDEKVLRLLRLAWRVGALDDVPPPQRARPVAQHDPITFAREIAAASMVLLENRDELPWEAAPRSVAVVGEGAVTPRTQGGGSASVIPSHVVTPLDGLRRGLAGTEVTHVPGVAVSDGLVPFPLAQLTNPVTNEPGVRVRFLDASGAELRVEDRRSAHLVWTGDVPDGAALLEATTHYRVSSSGPVEMGVETIGEVELFVDGHSLVSGRLAPHDDEMGTGLLAPPLLSAALTLHEGDDVLIRVVNDLASRTRLGNAASVSFGLVATDSLDEERIATAARVAADSDAVVVVVGTTNRDESEGSDRKTLALPGHQDEMVAAVAAANPRTVVVVNSGSPVLMPWRHDVAAVILTWFPGQEFGDALADVVTGIVEPGGRLPTSWPAEEADVPVLSTTPQDGLLSYEEGIHIGYRAWRRERREPAYPFGYGLGYTSFSMTDLSVVPGDDETPAVVQFRLTNTGLRAGKHVAQAYLSRLDTEAERPALWLAAFQTTTLEAGEEAVVRMEIPRRSLRHWDGGWHIEPGTFQVQVGPTVSDLQLAGEVGID